MKRETKHLIIGTAICAATILLFFVFSNKLPDNVPVQIKIDGSAGNKLPKPVFIFGIPIFFAAVNLVKGLSLSKRNDTSTYRFYVIPAIAVLVSIVTILLALSSI